MVISFYLKKAFNKDTMIIHEETICKLGRGKLPQLDKEHLQKALPNIILYSETLDMFFFS